MPSKDVPSVAEAAGLAPLRIGLVSLGCPKNLIDSEVMLGKIAQGKDIQVVGCVEDADIVVVNTCAFVEAAKRESLETIMEMTELKRRGALKGVVVTGCLAQRYPEELRKELLDVDAIVGVTAEDEVPGLLDGIGHRHDERALAAAVAAASPTARRAPKKLPMARTADADGVPEGPRVVIRDPSRPFSAEVGRLRLTPRHYSYLRVAEGCDHACTFCAIPGFRGRFRSKPEADILREAQELAKDGAREICLIAEDTNQYGQDRRDGTSLARLLPRLADVDGVEWIRILYAYPAYFPDELVKELARNPKVVKYLDIPLQHIADPVLKRMNRPGKQKTVELLHRLRDGIPGLALRTTFIAGFPGETKEDFLELLEFVKEFRFDRMGAFAYSIEDGTPAGSFEEQVAEKVKKSRRDRLMKAQQDIMFEKNAARVGTRVRAIVDELEGKGKAVARTEHDAPEIDGTIRIYKKGRDFKPGQLLDVKVVRADGYDLEGEPAA